MNEPECEPVYEPMGSVEIHVCSSSTESCLAPAEAGFIPVSDSVMVFRECVDADVQIDRRFLKCLKIM